MMIRRRRAMIVGLAVGTAAANRRHEQEMQQQRQQQQTVVYSGYPPGYNPYYPNTVQVVEVPPARSAPKTTVVVTAPPQQPQNYPSGQPTYPPQGYQNYPPQAYPPQGYPPQGNPPQGYPPQSYPPQNYPPQQYAAAPPPYQESDASAAAGAAAAAAGVAVAAAEAERRAKRELERRYFMIVNEANCSVLEMQNGTGRPGSRLMLTERRPDKPPRQMWYQDQNSVIRSMINDYALEYNKSADCLVLVPYTGDAKQRWMFKSNRIMNDTRPGECIGLRKLLFLHDDADVIVAKYDKKPYQHWRVDYA